MRTRRAGALIAFVLAGLLSLSVSQVYAQSGSTQRNQDRVNKEVYHELVMLPQLTIFDNLAYKVDGGNVTLLGSGA